MVYLDIYAYALHRNAPGFRIPTSFSENPIVDSFKDIGEPSMAQIRRALAVQLEKFFAFIDNIYLCDCFDTFHIPRR